MQKATLSLEHALGDSRVMGPGEAIAAYARDDSETSVPPPDLVVLAESWSDVVQTLAIAEKLRVPVTPRAGGTGRTGGAVPLAGGIVLCTRGMDQIVDIDRREGTAVVGPGVILGDFHAAVEAEGLFYPPDPNSWESCCLGGNVAENAAGPRAFKYGPTRDYVLGMKAALMGGQELFLGKRTVKGVTGYDLTSLVVGSEGTLALIGDIHLRLIAAPPAVMTLVALFDNVGKAALAASEITARGVRPRCIELLDAGTLEALRAAGNAVNPRAEALLLMDVDGDDTACERDAERVADAADSIGTIEVLVAQSAAHRDRLWAARRQMSGAVRKMARHKLSEDIVVPRQKIAELLTRVQRSCENFGTRSVSYGHAGDGNLHVNFLWDTDNERPAVSQSIEQLFVDVLELGGTLSGEHGIGVLKAPYLGLEQSDALIGLQKQLKSMFDPHSLLNPGKIFQPNRHGNC